MNPKHIEILKSEQELINDLMLNNTTSSQTIAKTPVSGSLPFSYVKSRILAGNAKSEYKQAAIVMLRNIYSEAGAMTD